MKSSEVTVTAFAGIRNTLPAERLSPHDLVEAVNVDLDTSGHPSRRVGQLTKVVGAAHSLWAEGDTCLYITGGAMKQLHPDFSSTLLALGLSSDPMAYLQVNNRVYHSNGTQTGVLDNGHVRGWGIDINGIAVNGTATNGSMPAGTYQFAMTYIRNDGQESGTGIASRIDLPDNSGIAFTWQVPADLSIVDAAIYVTLPNGETLKQAAVVDIELGHYTYAGGERSLSLATQWYDKPPAGQCLALYRGRIYIAVGAYLFATTAHGYEWCDMRDFRAFDGSRISLLAAVQSGIFVGTEKTLYFLAGDSFGENSITSKIDAGCVFGSLVGADGLSITGRPELAGVQVVLFTTTEGIIMGMPDGSIQNLTHDRYRFAVTDAGAAIFRSSNNTLNQYLLVMS